MARKMKNAPSWLVMVMILYAIICDHLRVSGLVCACGKRDANIPLGAIAHLGQNINTTA
jgi:hypothetical protein